MKKRIPGEAWNSQHDQEWTLDDHPILAGALAIVLLLAMAYSAVKFVQWAWGH